MKKDEIVKATPGITARKFRYNLSRASYEKEWGHQYERPGVFARVLAVLLRALPKIGPFRALSFKTPNEETPKLFMLSFNRTLDQYRVLLKQASAGACEPENLDLDTGQRPHPGEYRLADGAYAKLLCKLADKDFANTSPALREDILAFFADPDAPYATRADSRNWSKTLAALQSLKAAGAVAAIWL